MRRVRRLLLACTAFSAVVFATPASADPISAAIVGFVGLTGTAAAVATFAVNSLLYTGASWALSKLASKKFAGGGQERQVSVTSISTGETPREFVFGRQVVGGSLLDGFNYGGKYGTDWECLIIDIASHPIDALEGFWVWDEYHAFSSSGIQSGFESGLDIQFVNATPAGTAPPARFSASGWASTDVCAGETIIWFAYSAKLAEARGGRPQPKFQVRGAKLYDPRKDSTVPGGSGAHRWATPSTWQWNENLYLARYNWLRGIYAGGLTGTSQHLWVGRGLSAVEAPPERAFYAMNLCDEVIATRAGSQPRYHGGGVIRADEDFDVIEQRFADAMGGVIVQSEGGVEIEPGAAQAVVAEITDADLIVGEVIRFESFLPDPQRINTVVGRYIEPTQRWAEISSPVRRSLADIVEDGRPREEPLSLPFVTNGPHAQRVTEMRRRLNRMERRATTTLGPRFAALEEGDWIGWTSSRFHGGGRVVYRIEQYGRAASWRKTLVLREIAASAYSWNAAVDEYVPGQALPPEVAPPDPLDLDGVVLSAVTVNGQPGVRAVYDTPVDIAVEGVRLEVRLAGSAEVTPTTTRELVGVMQTTNGVPASSAIQARLIPLGPQHRDIAPVAWTNLTTTALVASSIQGQGPGATAPGSDVLNNALFGPNANRVTFSEFDKGTVGWEVSNPSANGGALFTGDSNNQKYVRYNWNPPAASEQIQISTSSAYNVRVVPGERLSIGASLYGDTNITSWRIEVQWLSQAGAVVQTDTVASGSGAPAITVRRAGFLTVPAGVAKARLFFTFVTSATASSDKNVFVAQVMVTSANAGQTIHPPYSPGPNAVPGADPTLGNISAGIVGQGPLATQSAVTEAQMLAAGVANAAIDTAFQNVSTCWLIGGNIGFTPSTSVVRETWSVAITGTPTSGNRVQLQQATGMVLAVAEGQRVEASVYVGGAGWANIQLYVSWLGTDGAFVSQASVGQVTSYGDGANYDIAAMTRIGGFLTAPAGARYAFLQLYARSNGSANPNVRMKFPLIAPALSGQTVLRSFTPGFLAVPGADPTMANIAAGIIGQGPGATASFPIYAGNSAALAAGAAVGTHFRDSTNSNAITTVMSGSTVGGTVADSYSGSIGRSYSTTFVLAGETPALTVPSGGKFVVDVSCTARSLLDGTTSNDANGTIELRIVKGATESVVNSADITASTGAFVSQSLGALGSLIVTHAYAGAVKFRVYVKGAGPGFSSNGDAGGTVQATYSA